MRPQTTVLSQFKSRNPIRKEKRSLRYYTIRLLKPSIVSEFKLHLFVYTNKIIVPCARSSLYQILCVHLLQTPRRRHQDSYSPLLRRSEEEESHKKEPGRVTFTSLVCVRYVFYSSSTEKDFFPKGSTENPSLVLLPVEDSPSRQVHLTTHCHIPELQALNPSLL